MLKIHVLRVHSVVVLYLVHVKVKVKVLLLPWIAASTNEVGFHVGPALPFPGKWEHCQVPITAG